MTAYDLMIKTNHYLIKDGKLTDSQKANIVNQFLTAISDERTKQSFYRGVKFPRNIDGEGRRMYPMFFIPPYNNGKKLKAIFNQTPTTHIFSANMYELEIIRLLYILAPSNEKVTDMVAKTLERLKTTCFGNANDGIGECFDTSLVVLRFLAAVSKDDTDWILRRIENYNSHVGEKKRSWHSQWYFWLCLSELPFEIAESELQKYKDEMIPWITTKSAVLNSEHDKTVHPVLLYVIRNCLCRFPEFEFCKNAVPYVDDKDGRLRIRG